MCFIILMIKDWHSSKGMLPIRYSIMNWEINSCSTYRLLQKHGRQCKYVHGLFLISFLCGTLLFVSYIYNGKTPNSSRQGNTKAPFIQCLIPQGTVTNIKLLKLLSEGLSRKQYEWLHHWQMSNCCMIFYLRV